MLSAITSKDRPITMNLDRGELVLLNVFSFQRKWSLIIYVFVFMQDENVSSVTFGT